QHASVGIAGRQPRWNVEALGDPQILLHARKVGADSHAGDYAAGVLTERSKQGKRARRKGGLVKCGIKHAAERRTVAVPTAADEDGHFRTDIDGGAALVDVAVVVETFQSHARVRIEPRRIARLDTQDASREWLLANKLGHAPVEHELDALLARAELQAPRERG